MARGTKRVRTKGDSPQHVAWVDAVTVESRELQPGVQEHELRFPGDMPRGERVAHARCWGEAARELFPGACVWLHWKPNGTCGVLIGA